MILIQIIGTANRFLNQLSYSWFCQIPLSLLKYTNTNAKGNNEKEVRESKENKIRTMEPCLNIQPLLAMAITFWVRVSSRLPRTTNYGPERM